MYWNITISTSDPKKKHLVRLLAAKLGFASVSRYIEARIDQDAAKFLSAEDWKLLDIANSDEPNPKTSSGRRA